jgi:hypothetical protein
MDELLSDEATEDRPQDDEEPQFDEEAESQSQGPTRRSADRRRSRPQDEINELLTVACTPGLSHGSFRLYVILAAVANRRKSWDRFFPVTLNGLQKVHPGTTGKAAGITTIFKQITELKAQGLIDMRASLHRSEPDLPVLVKVLYPRPGGTWSGSRGSRLSWEATDGSWLTTSDVGEVIDMP